MHQLKLIHILLTSFFLLTSLTLAIGQKKKSPVPADPCTSFLAQAEKEILSRIQSHNETRTASEKDALAPFDEYLVVTLQNQFEMKEFSCDAMANKLVSDAVHELQSFHPALLPGSYQILVSKDPTINASTLGYQTIVVNGGLITAIQSREELLFVIAHELAHDKLGHHDQIKKKAAYASSKESKKNETNILIKNRVNKREAIEEYRESLVLDVRAFSRQQELQADSLALEIITPAIRHTALALKAVDRLLSIHEGKMHHAWSDIFNFPDFPFQSYWDDTTSPIVSPDSISKEKIKLFSTHPNIEDRIAALQKRFDADTLLVPEPYTVDENIRDNLYLEGIEFAFLQRNYAAALYKAVGLYNSEQPDVEVCMWIGKIFKELYDARNSHEFEYFVQNTPATISNSYEELVLILNNMRVKDLVKTGYYFLHTQPFHDPAYEELKMSLKNEF